ARRDDDAVRDAVSLAAVPFGAIDVGGGPAGAVTWGAAVNGAAGQIADDLAQNEVEAFGSEVKDLDQRDADRAAMLDEFVVAAVEAGRLGPDVLDEDSTYRELSFNTNADKFHTFRNFVSDP
ncbi:hypothetical protein, partial [Isoptericola croceus]|uniref:hypothetical protein n=1 Tax=Isoptericola croceus TaxID=3031406 RepID=UPI0023F6C22F